MGKGRLEAFSDGVLAILITIMVLELKVPQGGAFRSLQPLLPALLSYLLSFVYLGIYWNNHHHMLHTVTRVSAGILWANLHLLFWLSLVPFVTGWMGENQFSAPPTALYGFILLMAATAYWLLQRAILSSQGPQSRLALYAAAIPSAFLSRWVAGGLYVLVALIWLVPDRRIERAYTLPGD